MEARTCSQPGCSCAPLARGMCRGHYRKWLAAFPGERQKSIDATRAAVLAALPATQSKIVADTGMAPKTVRRVLDYLRSKDRAHIGEFEPPSTPGTHFVAVYEAGPGEDAVLTKKMQREQKQFTMRKCQAVIALREKMAAIPPSSRWAAALLAA